MKMCRKCNSKIPTWIEIDGKKRNLNNRKLCLNCSPFGLHNTKRYPEQPSKKYREGKKLNQKYLDAVRRINYLRQWKRKNDLINMSGGRCQTCGYNKCQAAMHFHHRDRNTKKFCLSLTSLSSKKWEDILNEWQKCDLLCSNCHAEIEQGIASAKDTEYQRMKKDFFINLKSIENIR